MTARLWRDAAVTALFAALFCAGLALMPERPPVTCEANR
jgi:hypothetical protein